MGASASLFLHNQCLIFGEQFKGSLVNNLRFFADDLESELIFGNINTNLFKILTFNYDYI